MFHLFRLTNRSAKAIASDHGVSVSRHGVKSAALDVRGVGISIQAGAREKFLLIVPADKVLSLVIRLVDLLSASERAALKLHIDAALRLDAVEAFTADVFGKGKE
jgi:hypothetical protein